MDATVRKEVTDLTQAVIGNVAAADRRNVDVYEQLLASIADAERARSALAAMIKRLKAERIRQRDQRGRANRIKEQVSRFEEKLKALREEADVIWWWQGGATHGKWNAADLVKTRSVESEIAMLNRMGYVARLGRRALPPSAPPPATEIERVLSL